MFRGVNGEGQSSIFGYAIRDYIEETSASLAHIARANMQTADISYVGGSQNIGQGGSGENRLDPSLVQENSLMAFNPVMDDYADKITTQRSQVLEYTVQPGDLLSFIASDYGVSVNSIIWANNLRNADSLQPGQILKIPPVSGIIHMVKKGDTIASVVRKYGVDEEKIIAFNGLPKDGQLNIGEEIIIPGGQLNGVSASVKTVLPSIKPFSYLPDLGDYFVLPTSGFNWGRIHGRNGVDIANSCGTPIYAAADGTVITADSTGWNGGFGKFIKISHANGTETLYAHATKLLAIVGQNVSRGTLIALMGTTGNSTGCHLHFEVHGARNPLAKY